MDPDVLDGGSIETGDIETIGNSIATVVRNIGIVLAAIILMILGVKYMLGSAEEKADYKSSMIPYLIGAVLCFAASAIAGAFIYVAGKM